MDSILDSSENSEHPVMNRYILSTETGQRMNEGPQMRGGPLPEEVVQLCLASKRGEPIDLSDNISTVSGIVEDDTHIDCGSRHDW